MNQQNDHELIGLAGQAAGYPIYESTDGSVQARPVWVFYVKSAIGELPYEVIWNPLNSAADALILAAKLRFNITWEHVGDSEYAVVSTADLGEISRCTVSQNPHEALCRAIVIAAVEIKKMIGIDYESKTRSVRV